MRLESISSVVIFSLVLFLTQRSGAQQTPKPVPTGYEGASQRDVHSVRLEVPLGPDCPSPDFAFVVEKNKKDRIPLQLASRLFSETLSAVMSMISPDHRLRVRLVLILRLGQLSDSVTVRRGNQGDTIMSMRKWNDALFAEMLARAVLGSIVSESELDRDLTCRPAFSWKAITLIVFCALHRAQSAKSILRSPARSRCIRDNRET